MVQTTPLVAGLGVAAVAYASRAAVLTFQSFKAAPPRLRQFYKVRFDLSYIASGAAGAVGSSHGSMSACKPVRVTCGRLHCGSQLGPARIARPAC